MEWPGIRSDEPVIYLSDRIEKFREVAFKQAELGKAYCVYLTPKELEEKREAATKKI